MAKVLPSDVVESIQWTFRWVLNTKPRPDVTRHDGADIAAVVALVERVPEAVLRLSPKDYRDFLWAVASLEYLAKMIEGGQKTVPGGWSWPMVENVDAMTCLFTLLKKCPTRASQNKRSDSHSSQRSP